MNEIEIRVFDMSAVLKPSDACALVLEELGGGSANCAIFKIQDILVFSLDIRDRTQTK